MNRKSYVVACLALLVAVFMPGAFAKDKAEPKNNRGVIMKAAPVAEENTAPAAETAPIVPVEEAAPAGPPPDAATPSAPAEKESPVYVVKTPGDAAVPDAVAFAALREEVAALRNDLTQIRQTLDMLVNQEMANLEKENEQLRAELQRAGEERREFGYATFPNVPRPGGDLTRQIVGEPSPLNALTAQAPETEGEATEPAPEQTAAEPAEKPVPPAEGTVPEHLEDKTPPPAPVPFDFTVTQEWGRTPEQAKELGEAVTSLKGIAGVVPPGSTKSDLEKLGRELHEKYKDYDNINIEIFDDPVSARIFSEKNSADADHRVLSVSKYSASNRDVILRYESGQAVEVLK